MGVKNIKWEGTISSTSAARVNWQWAAAVYKCFSTTSSNDLGIKPADDNHLGPYYNSDHAGTPECFRSYVTGGHGRRRVEPHRLLQRHRQRLCRVLQGATTTSSLLRVGRLCVRTHDDCVMRPRYFAQDTAARHADARHRHGFPKRFVSRRRMSKIELPERRRELSVEPARERLARSS